MHTLHEQHTILTTFKNRSFGTLWISGTPTAPWRPQIKKGHKTKSS